MSRRTVVALILGAVAVVVAVALVIVFVVRPGAPATDDAGTVTPGQQFFDLLRLTEEDVAPLGLIASDSGATASTLSDVAGALTAAWDAASADPQVCTFAGVLPAGSPIPLSGTESDADEFWSQQSVSGVQSLSTGGPAFVTIASRVFDGEQAALAFLLASGDAVEDCGFYTSDAAGQVATTILTPLVLETLGESNTGWVATTPGWTPSDGEPPADLQTWTIDIQRGPVISRVTLLATQQDEAAAGPFLTDVASIVAGKLATAIPVGE